MKTNQIFKDLKVIELASVLAGPAVGLFFAEMGAQVIKIENKTTGGDVTRSWRLPKESKETVWSAYYCSINWNKESHLLNLREVEDRKWVLEMIKDADVVISNFKMSSAQKMGMDYESLKAINPRLIYAHLTSFGPDIDRPAFDVVLQAEAGFLFMNGEPGRDPVKMPVALIDLLAAHQLKEGILVALLQRSQSQQGAYVSTSLLEAAIASLANQASNWLMVGHLPQAMGTMHPNIAPYGDVFYTKDDKALVLAVGTEKQFQVLCKLINLPELMEDKRFVTNHLRVENRTALKALMFPAFALKTREDWMALMTKAGVPAGSIRNMQEVFDLPMAEEMILEEKMPDGSVSKRVKTVAFQVEG